MASQVLGNSPLTLMITYSRELPLQPGPLDEPILGMAYFFVHKAKLSYRLLPLREGRAEVARMDAAIPGF